MAFLRSATCTLMRPNCPGSMVCRELGKRACNSRVAVLGSTWFRVLDVAGGGEFRLVGENQGERQGGGGQSALAGPRQVFRFSNLEADPDGVERHDGRSEERRVG